ncbi:hypothetical protein [Infirmifilum sp. NZ]|uniref:hypothetical protein n=1 Tax=Infirmifilum sp. NZ TaxID=2926850 RepID=UPI0027A6FBDE|nr:hypothetical protein [Infirmifilum sp. NZ]UNQ73526.1 hypothetical protein MOV14_00585 [Infirmifilum sp. NZ]
MPIKITPKEPVSGKERKRRYLAVKDIMVMRYKLALKSAGTLSDEEIERAVKRYEEGLSRVDESKLEAFDQQAELDKRLGELLTRNNIIGVNRVAYRSFALKLLAHTRKGGSLSRQFVEKLIEEYATVERLKREVLEEIARELFGVSLSDPRD